jgi:hypothetical protein
MSSQRSTGRIAMMGRRDRCVDGRVVWIYLERLEVCDCHLRAVQLVSRGPGDDGAFDVQKGNG